jgi:hypothetical protein
MKKFASILGSLVIAFLVFAPVALAADEAQSDRGALIALGSDVTLPAGEQVDAVIVVRGTATIQGQAKTVFAIDGRVDLQGATVETVVALGSPVVLGAGTTVQGDILRLESSVENTSGAVVAGEIRDVGPQLVTLGVALLPVLLLLFIGIGLVTIVAGLTLAAIAARQVRDAEHLISSEPGPVIVFGIGGLILPLLLAIGLMITVVGAPLGFAILIFVWPLVAYLGYLVAGIWIGDWILARMRPGVVRERPYLAAVVGLLLLQVAQLVPPITAIASLFGFGAVLLLAWRTFRSEPVTTAGTHTTTPAPMYG